ncbi:HTH domain-containing protein (plasmid) [Polymorphobacter sp. PAMC 29334]|uniref:HTH domain-containing protein n=1 Tax=Polymorphobacter sp. PAMC 29334 TaxID=2862331 RepID=UPI001C74280D|nr:HTH domain-containing protein [Polymorphobacter sp. PAMC 29334]QYE37132.1 HTH domain-containing protein [Polymorphobacter sp. PAMC 29334]
MRRAERLFQIIQILRRSTLPVTGAALAAELEVSTRTVYRDVAHMMAQRVPITGEAGLGYLLAVEYDMPPLMLTRAELEAIVLGAQWVTRRGDPLLSPVDRRPSGTPPDSGQVIEVVYRYLAEGVPIGAERDPLSIAVCSAISQGYAAVQGGPAWTPIYTQGLDPLRQEGVRRGNDRVDVRLTMPEETVIELYHGEHTRSLRVRWVLEEMGLPYKLAPVLFPPRTRQPGFLLENPLGSLPLLIDGAVRMTESMAICEFLAAKYGPTTLMVDPKEPGFADYRQFCWFGEAGLMPPVGVFLVYIMMTPPNDRPGKVIDNARATFARRLEAVVQVLRRSDYMAAERFTLADVSVGYALELADRLGEGTTYPIKVAAYLERLASRPAHQRAAALLENA